MVNVRRTNLTENLTNRWHHQKLPRLAGQPTLRTPEFGMERLLSQGAGFWPAFFYAQILKRKEQKWQLPNIMPLGFIDRPTETGAIIMLTRPSDSHTLRPETLVTLRSRSAGEPLATARVRGVITSVGIRHSHLQGHRDPLGLQMAKRGAGPEPGYPRLPGTGRQLQTRPHQDPQRGPGRRP